MKLLQFLTASGERGIALVENADIVRPIPRFPTVFALANHAIENRLTIADCIRQFDLTETLDYAELIDQNRVLPPIDHPDPAHTLVTGTGLTHLGSADTRNAMHAKLQQNEDSLTDSMKMFRLGMEGGKPEAGKTGVQPEWFYKGTGDIVAAPGQAIPSPDFALDGGEEPEIVGLYIIGPDGTPFRIGFALGNEFSDHVTERQNYLYLAHSKLRNCAIGPELLIGDLPKDIQGTSRIIRNGSVAWQKPFLTGENNMSHSIANLEYHHFKYSSFRRPGDIHIHFLGTGTLSFGDGFQTQAGDIFEIEAPEFGRPLRNQLTVAETQKPEVFQL